jgi:integrase
VFTTEVGEPYDPRNALRALQVAAGRAGSPREPGCTPGHSSTTVMLGHGVPLMVVHEFLGHSSIAITGAVHGPSRPTSPAAPWTSSVPPSVSTGRPMVVKTAHQLESRPRVADVPR